VGVKTMENFSEVDLFDYGADWIRCDLHLHSPLVDSFKLPSGVNLNSDSVLENLMGQYIAKLKQKEIKICAITDYQQIRTEWFNKFQEKALQEKIFVFPGIELSITHGRGLHILIIFDYESDIDGINDYIKSLDQAPEKPLINSDRIHRDISLKNNLSDVLNELHDKFSSLVIFPHPEDQNGLLDANQTKEAANLLKLADAIEFISDSGIKKLVSTGEINKDFFKNKIALLENTDPKSIDEIGCKQRGNKTKCTYIKLSSVSINAIRIAFQDPSLRVKLYEKPEELGDKLESIDISGAKFLKDVKIKFNSNLNSLIGGRGVGKSAIIESIRYCLDLPSYSEESFREEFVQNVVGSGGKITVKLLRRYGDKKFQYTVSRVIGQKPIVEEKNIPPDELFEENSPILLGQKELYVLSNNQDFQRKLVDQLIGD
jgi:chromosome segregation protein